MPILAELPVNDARGAPTMSADTCLLCEARNAKRRPGRLGRYAQTCDACEERRGTHLATTGSTPRIVLTTTRANGIAR